MKAGFIFASGVDNEHAPLRRTRARPRLLNAGLCPAEDPMIIDPSVSWRQREVQQHLRRGVKPETACVGKLLFFTGSQSVVRCIFPGEMADKFRAGLYAGGE